MPSSLLGASRDRTCKTLMGPHRVYKYMVLKVVSGTTETNNVKPKSLREGRS